MPRNDTTLKRAVQMLSRRSWATAELRERLLQRHEASEVDAAIAKLTRLGYLDDALRAEQYVATSRARERAARLLRSELIERGVGARFADAALRKHDDGAAALRAARRRLGALRGLDEQRRARRLRDFLARRGFGGATITSTMETVLAGASAAG